MELKNTISKIVEYDNINFIDTNFVLEDSFADFDRIAEEFNATSSKPFIIDVTIQCMHELEKFAGLNNPEKAALQAKAKHWLEVFKTSFISGGKYRLNANQRGPLFDNAMLAEATIHRLEKPVTLFSNDQDLTNEMMLLNHSKACRGYRVSVYTMKNGTQTHLIKKDDTGYRLIDILYKMSLPAKNTTFAEAY
ncbi:MAG: hypothetical protein MJ189_06010 [Coriobacteriales bacterium]|nr:hypothetical protein [Coriobacteriales bacterium]